DDLQLAVYRITLGGEAMAGIQHLGVSRRVTQCPLEPKIKLPGARVLGGEQQTNHGHRRDHRRGRTEQPRIADTAGERRQRAGESETASGAGALAGPRCKIDFEHHGVDPQAARSASPTGSISNGATSSVDRNSSAPSRTVILASAFAG